MQGCPARPLPDVRPATHPCNPPVGRVSPALEAAQTRKKKRWALAHPGALALEVQGNCCPSPGGGHINRKAKIVSGPPPSGPLGAIKSAAEFHEGTNLARPGFFAIF